MWTRLSRFIQKPEMVFLVLAILFGVFSAIAVPQLSVPDENMHFLRSYTLASGHVAGDSKNQCVFAKDVYKRAYSIYEGDYATHYKQRVNLNDTKVEWCGTAASYSPLVHIPQAIGVFVANLLWSSTGFMILLGRLANLALFVGVTYYIIKKVRVGKWVFAVIALFPTVIQQAASLSADSFTLCSDLCCGSFPLKQGCSKNTNNMAPIHHALTLIRRAYAQQSAKYSAYFIYIIPAKSTVYL